MRLATVVLRSRSPDDYLLEPARFVAETPRVTGGTIEHVNTLSDGTAVTLMWFRAPVDEVRSFVEDTTDDLATDMALASDGVVVYSHFQPSGIGEVLLGLRQRHEVVFDVPMEFTDDGGLRAPLIGREESLQAAVDGLPDEVDVALELLTEYDPAAREPLAALTDRQLETLRLAVDRGYYASPSETSADELADELGCSRGTVSEHLRKAEQHVLSALVG